MNDEMPKCLHGVPMNLACSQCAIDEIEEQEQIQLGGDAVNGGVLLTPSVDTSHLDGLCYMDLNRLETTEQALALVKFMAAQMFHGGLFRKEKDGEGPLDFLLVELSEEQKQRIVLSQAVPANMPQA